MKFIYSKTIKSKQLFFLKLQQFLTNSNNQEFSFLSRGVGFKFLADDRKNGHYVSNLSSEKPRLSFLRVSIKHVGNGSKKNAKKKFLEICRRIGAVIISSECEIHYKRNITGSKPTL